MIENILGFLKNIHLSATEWLAVTVAGIISGLVAALKIQGSELHKAQVALLSQTLDSKQARAAQDTEAARAIYRDALMAFLKAGGKMGLILAFLFSPPALSASVRSEGSPRSPLLPKCESALSACDSLTKAQDSQIKALQDAVKAWKVQASKSSTSDAPVLITSIASGIIAGIASGSVLDAQKGVAVGGVVGGVMGFGVGLIINGVK